jgi:mannan endo-1,4-beta-mannosidase
MNDRRTFLMGLAGAAALAVGGGGVAGAAPTNRERLLTWITSLQGRQEGRVLIGQEISAWDSGTYDRFVTQLFRNTGKRPAVVGLSLLEPGDYDRRGVDRLVDHHHLGGLVTVSTHWSHPWRAHPTNGDKYRVKKDTDPKPDLRQLLSTAADSPQKRLYWQQVADLATVLRRLHTEGAVVLLRPFHEMNGPWFWWGHDLTKQSTALVQLWQDLHRHLTAQFDNLIWFYSPATSWNAAIYHYYPERQYVDLSGVDIYSDDLIPYDPGHRPDADDWTELKKLGHPGGLAEYGPGGDKFPNGAQTLITRLTDTYTTAVIAHCWTSWAPGQQRALVEQVGIGAALNHPVILTQDEVRY